MEVETSDQIPKMTHPDDSLMDISLDRIRLDEPAPKGPATAPSQSSLNLRVKVKRLDLKPPTKLHITQGRKHKPLNLKINNSQI